MAKERYTYSEEHNPVEIMNLESVVIGRVSRPEPPCVPAGDGDALLADDAITGPAMVEETTTNIVVRRRWTPMPDASGTYRLTRA